jgi:very-short-patch-repair endonuclease
VRVDGHGNDQADAAELREAGFEVVHIMCEEIFFQREWVAARIREAFRRSAAIRWAG